jgi:VWFA-related protein
MERIFRAEQDTASRFLRRVIQEKDLAMVMSFDIDVNLLADFTNDHSRLENAIRRAHINAPRRYVTPGTVPDPGGGTNLYDALYLGCTEQLARETGRKALVVLTDAWDTGSRMNLEEALEACQRTDTVLHFIVIAENYGFGYSTAREGVARKLAEETGGRAISVDSEKDLEKAFDVLVEELRSQYTLGFYPTNPNRDGKFRRLKVETTRKDTKVLSRKGYYPPKS